MRVLLSVRPGGFTLAPPILKELFSRSPQYFDGPFDTAEFSLGEAFDLSKWPNAVLHEDQLFFLLTNERLMRMDAWLVARFDELGSRGLQGPYCSELKTVEVPEGVCWHVYEYEDGSEAVHEDHRVWC